MAAARELFRGQSLTTRARILTAERKERAGTSYTRFHVQPERGDKLWITYFGEVLPSTAPGVMIQFATAFDSSDRPYMTGYEIIAGDADGAGPPPASDGYGAPLDGGGAGRLPSPRLPELEQIADHAARIAAGMAACPGDYAWPRENHQLAAAAVTVACYIAEMCSNGNRGSAMRRAREYLDPLSPVNMTERLRNQAARANAMRGFDDDAD